MVFPFWPAAAAWLKLHCLNSIQTRSVCGIGALGVVLRIQQPLSQTCQAWLSCFPLPLLQPFLPVCSARAPRGSVFVSAYCHQSSVQGAPPSNPQPTAVTRQFHASFLHAQLIESWKLAFIFQWPYFLCLPVINHPGSLKGDIFFNISHFKKLNGEHLKKLDGSVHSHADIYLPDSLQNLQFQIKTKFFVHYLQMIYCTFFFLLKGLMWSLFSVNFTRADVVIVVQQWTKLISLM